AVEQLDANVRVELTEPPQLAVLLADEALPERGQLDVELEVWEPEVGREALGHNAVQVPQDGERMRLVLPFDAIEVEDAGELRLARVGERGGRHSGRNVGPRRGHGCLRRGRWDRFGPGQASLARRGGRARRAGLHRRPV